MERLFIDESGSMTVSHCNIEPYFIICIVRAKNPDKLKRLYQRFVRSNLKELKASDTKGLMFKDDKFIELKGNCLTPQLKRKFMHFICQDDCVEIFYIVSDNSKADEKFYSNTSRAFNYLLRLAIEFYLNHDYIDGGKIDIQLDERNEKTETKYFLENYLNTEIGLSRGLFDEFTVKYFDSANNKLIQVADVFSNLLLSEYKTGAYSKNFALLREDGYIRHFFMFPL